jgi:hypothetical protein
MRHGGAGKEERRLEVHLDDDVPVRLGHLLAAPAPEHPGDVAQRIDLAEVIDCLADRSGALRAVGQVERQFEHLAAHRADFLGSTGKRLARNVEDGHIRAQLGDPDGAGTAKASARARHQGNLSAHVLHCRHALSPVFVIVPAGSSRCSEQSQELHRKLDNSGTLVWIEMQPIERKELA